MTDLYILDKNGNAVKENDFMVWGNWYKEHENRMVVHTHVNDFIVSTVFLGIDHNFSKEGPPILWETMVFKTNGDDQFDEVADIQERYCSLEEAKEGHEKVVDTVTRILRIGTMKNSESRKRYNLDLSEEMYSKLKEMADSNGTTMATKIRNYISIGLWIEKSKRDPDFTLAVRDSEGERILITPL